MISEPGTPTLDQLRVFLTAVEAGSFSAAARKLSRATSVVSYSIANLEMQLGVSLFDRQTTRKPQLTEAGRMVLAEARIIANGISGLRAKVKGLQGGLETEIYLTLDSMLPSCQLIEVLGLFHDQFPTVSLHLHVDSIGAVTQRVLKREATIGISGPLPPDTEGIERVSVGSVELVPVAAPGHPLASGGPVAHGASREHVQLILSDRSALNLTNEYSLSSSRTWRLADLNAKYMLLKAGVGWGNMPMPMVEQDITSGKLIRLDLPDHKASLYGFDAIYRTDSPPGPASSWLIEQFARQG
ncbi:LysR family transcriptional regulator [Pseudomonas sp. NA-150]|uniref:LysR family transcriptional regulator n=1 Tax=Pseudomonas sp. NA-150 TaxID=3367525 RepID=UPI0037C9CEA8